MQYVNHLEPHIKGKSGSGMHTVASLDKTNSFSFWPSVWNIEGYFLDSQMELNPEKKDRNIKNIK
jgi:hypothetical protein